MNLFEKRYLDKIGLRKIKGQKEICKESASTDRMDYIKSYFTIFFILICFRLILEVFAVIYQKYSNAHNVTLKYLKHDYFGYLWGQRVERVAVLQFAKLFVISKKKH